LIEKKKRVRDFS